MKSFFEEYGFVAIAAIVVVLLLVMVKPIGNRIQGQVNDLTDGFGTQVNEFMNNEFDAIGSDTGDIING